MTMLEMASTRPTTKMNVPNTNTCGGIPIRDAPYTHSGNVGFAPATKFDVTKSSMESANAISAPARIPGKMMGSVTRRNVVHAFAPRSLAASSSERSKPDRRARTVIATYAMLNMTWASTRVTNPRARLTVTNSPSRDTPSTISGAAMFMNITCSNATLPRNRYRTRARAMAVPRIVATAVLAAASLSERKNADVSPGIWLHSAYHLVVNPFHPKLTWGRAVVTLLKL